MSNHDRMGGDDSNYFEDAREPVILTDDLVPQRPDWLAPLPEEEAHLRDYLRVLWARKATLVLTFAGVLGLVSYVTYTQKPTYAATSVIMIDRRSPSVAEVVNPNAAGGYGSEVPAEYYKTQSELLRSRQIVEPVAKALRVNERAEFQTSAHDPIAAFVDAIRVDPVASSRLVKTTVESQDPSFAMRAANALVEELREQNSHRVGDLNVSALTRLEDMEKEVRPRYEAAERALQQYKEENNILSADESQSSAVQELRVLTEELGRARAERARLSADAQTAEATGGMDLTAPSADDNRFVDELRMEQSRVEAERDELLKHFKADHPQIRAIQARLARIAQQRTDAEQGTVASTSSRSKGRAASVIALAKNRLAAAEAQEKELSAAIESASARVADFGRKGIRLQFLDGEAQAAAAAYKDVSHRLQDVQMALATGVSGNNISIVDAASEPLFPARPRKPLNLTLGALFGLICGIGLCFLREYFDRAIKDSSEVERLLGYPVLGQMPCVPKSAVPARELAAVANPFSPVAESFRSIRAALEFGVPTGRRTAFVVTSAVADDGKTMASVNLAYAFAQTGRSVLLVDADMRRPRIHEIFGMPVEDGLSATLSSGQASLHAVRKTKISGLDVMTAGPIPRNPAELLGSNAMRDFLDLAESFYDVVILDAPRAVAVADVAVLLSHGSQAVIVVRALATRRDDLIEATRILNQAAQRVAGVILNMADAPGVERHGYGRGVNFGYGAKDRRPARASERASDPGEPATA